MYKDGTWKRVMKIPEFYMEVGIREFSLTDGDV